MAEKENKISLGLVANRYEQHELIGSGGLANVYMGWDTKERSPVAIKRLNTEAEKAFREEGLGSGEAKCLASISHPNVIRLIDSGEDEEGIFYITELVIGHNMDQVLHAAPLVEKDFIEFARQALMGLFAIHTADVVHCDIKPENLILTAAPSSRLGIKILDFGLARFSGEPEASALVAKEEIMGTAEYVAPEQFQGEKATKLSDLYSIGHVFYHSLAGQAAFERSTNEEIARAHLNESPRPLTSICPDLNSELAEWVHKFIKPLPKERHSSAKLALVRLENIIDPSADFQLSGRYAIR